MAVSHGVLLRLRNAVAALVAIVISATPALAAQSTGTASAAILAPVTVAKVDDLAFGKVIAGSAPASVTITPSGGFTCGTGLTCLDAHSPARFAVTGAPGQTVRVDVDQQIVLTSSGGARMTAVLQPVANNLRLAIANGGGANIFGIGGILNVGAYQAEGIYSGTFTVNIDYN